MITATISNTLEDTPNFFIINMIAADIFNEFQINIPYRGKSKPSLTSNLTVSEYSLDNLTWYPMTLTGDSEITDLELTRIWNNFSLTWNALIDIINKISDPEEGLYNRNMWVRFKAVSGSNETTLIAYRIFFKNPTVQLNTLSSNSALGIDGWKLMEQAPEVF